MTSSDADPDRTGRSPDLTDLVVAAVQLPSVPADIPGNARAAAPVVRAAAARGARVTVLPELYLCGYDMATIAARPDDCDLRVDRLDVEGRELLAPLVAACADTGVLVLTGASLRHEGGRRTIGLLAVDDGPRPVRAVYDKLHLCGDEADHFVPGEHPTVLDVDGWPVGLSICYDGCFPEHARAVADAGALVYVTSMAYVVGSEHRRDLYYRARAVENGMYVVASGLVGGCGAAAFGGGSVVLDPEGRVLDAVADGSSGTALGACRRTDLTATRRAHRMHAQHRPDLGSVRFDTLG